MASTRSSYFHSHSSTVVLTPVLLLFFLLLIRAFTPIFIFLLLQDEKIGYWDNVYGFDYSCVKRCVMEEPIVDSVDCANIVSNSCCILDLDLYTCTVSDLDFVAPYRLKMSRKDDVHAMVSSFVIL